MKNVPIYRRFRLNLCVFVASEGASEKLRVFYRVLSELVANATGSMRCQFHVNQTLYIYIYKQHCYTNSKQTYRVCD